MSATEKGRSYRAAVHFPASLTPHQLRPGYYPLINWLSHIPGKLAAEKSHLPLIITTAYVPAKERLSLKAAALSPRTYPCKEAGDKACTWATLSIIYPRLSHT